MSVKHVKRKNENKTIILFKNNRIQNLGVGVWSSLWHLRPLPPPTSPTSPTPSTPTPPPTSYAIYVPFAPNVPSPLPSAAPPSSPQPREMENISRGPGTLSLSAPRHRCRTSVAKLQKYRLQSPPSFKCNVLRESLSVDSQTILAQH